MLNKEIVLTPTVDLQQSDITYDSGQLVIGSAWNRYGNPGQTIGDDWPIILAHELSHYLLFHDDTYVGLDAGGKLKAVKTCLGSAMGDVYGDATATEFIFDPQYWQTNCSETLAAKTLKRTEWETMKLWYPNLVKPLVSLSGPSIMPYDFTTVEIYSPLTPTNALPDPTLYIDYAGSGQSSSEARVYLIKQDRKSVV